MWVRFGDIVHRANTKEDKDNTEKIYYVGGEHIPSSELLITEKGLIDGSTIGPMFYFGFKTGDILFVSRNPHLKKAGMVTFDGICSEKTFVLETNDESILLQKYLAIVMQSDHFWQYAEKNKSGSVNYFVNWSTLANYEFELPTIDRQKEISDLIWAANDAKISYYNLINAIDDLVKSQFIEMFDHEDKMLSLAEICEHFGDGDWIESKDQSEEGIRLIQTGNIGDGEYIDKNDKARFISEETFERLNCTEVLPGDILVSRLPDPIGRACIVPSMQKSITAVDCTIIRLKENVLPAYFVAYTQTPTYQAQIDSVTTGSTRKRVSRANLGKVLVPIPDINKQRRFIELSNQSDKSKFELKKAISDINELIKSLMQQDT